MTLSLLLLSEACLIGLAGVFGDCYWAERESKRQEAV
jgi:hypothetical protein